MALYLLDTDAVIDFLQGMDGAQRLFRDLYARHDRLCVNDVVIGEVFSGAAPSERADVAGFLASLRLLQCTFQAARLAGEWRYAYARRGLQLAMTDCLNASTASVHNASVITRNVKDYPMDVPLRELPR